MKILIYILAIVASTSANAEICELYFDLPSSRPVIHHARHTIRTGHLYHRHKHRHFHHRQHKKCKHISIRNYIFYPCVSIGYGGLGFYSSYYTPYGGYGFWGRQNILYPTYRINSIPELSTFSLILTGLVALWAKSRTRKRVGG